MVEETIRSIRETEKKADEIIREAEAKSLAIREEAGVNAAKVTEELISAARAKALAMAEQAKENGDRAEAEAMAETEKEISGLKASAMKREKEAVDLVISLLA